MSEAVRHARTAARLDPASAVFAARAKQLRGFEEATAAAELQPVAQPHPVGTLSLSALSAPHRTGTTIPRPVAP